MENTLFTVNNVWMMMCTALVFLMHLGFSLLEIGLTRQKNTFSDGGQGTMKPNESGIWDANLIIGPG